ncbi:CWF19-like protein 2 homolog [Anopheles marshallii]|uniref:CWF19-like protein 2 homolog n=1 Tax=Anopheles marshallii TaxID=1521116 RepID=UPI00237B6907|nr:CWF19-like protein 2 homolog [Anopheles marshallii]
MGSSTSDSELERKPRKHKKKEKKSKKSKKEKKHKKDKKHKRHRRTRSSSSSTGSESDEWVEALPAAEFKRDAEEVSQQLHEPKLEREDWMNSMLIPTYSKEPKKEDKKNPTTEQYDPKTSVRELNPHWRNGGTGLPSFRKPANEDEDNEDGYRYHRTAEMHQQHHRTSSAGWKKSAKEKQDPSQRECKGEVEKTTERVTKAEPASEEFLTDEQLNELGAKIIKAELVGNATQAETLKLKLEKAKAYRHEMQAKKKQQLTHDEAAHKRRKSTEDTVTYVTGKQSSDSQRANAKKQKRYQQNLPPGPALSDKFRSERHENDNMDAQFFKVSSKLGDGKRLENIFDHQKASSSTGGVDAIEERTVRDMNRMNKAQADCERCLNSGKFGHEQLISMGKNVYLSIPTWRALQPKHCFIVPVGHYPCLTQVDEDVHQEIVDVCKTLVQMFRKHQMEVVFFETVRYLNRNPHMYIQCVPAKDYEMAPFYFKKAILESETEWAMNKKLHNVDGFNVRRTIPKGLPYFWVNFNMESGFAHVIEDQEMFPVTFATETIAGILGLDTRDWRKPRKEMNPAQRVEEFKHWWREYDAVLQTK